jgi:hypothetical protein
MISLEKILKELNNVTDTSSGAVKIGSNNPSALARVLGPQFLKIVISDENGGGFSDSQKRNELFSLIKSELVTPNSIFKFNSSEIQKIMDELKYYPATNKIVGNLPKFMFKTGNIPSMKSIKISKEIYNISPTIEIKQKK